MLLKGSNEQQQDHPFPKHFPYAFAAASLETAPGPEGPVEAQVGLAQGRVQYLAGISIKPLQAHVNKVLGQAKEPQFICQCCFGLCLSLAHSLHALPGPLVLLFLLLLS